MAIGTVVFRCASILITRFRQVWRWIAQQWKSEPVAFATLLLACTTFLLVCFTALQWHALVNATKTSERAWVTVKRVSFSDYFVVGQHPLATVVTQNTGKSPATDLIITGGVGHLPLSYLVGSMTLKLILPSAPPVSVGVLSPGPEYAGELRAERALSVEDLAAMRNGSTFWCIVGELRYRDIFGASHWTQYCYALDARVNQVFTCGHWNVAR